MNIYYKLLPIFFSMTLMLLTGCSGGNEGFETPPPATQAPPTGIADENSFTISRNPAAVEGLNYTDVESEVTVLVADRHNHPVPDDTVIRFLTNGGSIEPSCVTEGGSCKVTWRSQDPIPGVAPNPGLPGKAVILAYTEGEESFLDLNDNDAHDAGELIRDISEPYIDHNLNGTRDADEEFVDYDADNIFDLADGLYTGESCVGDNTVCKRTRMFVWGSTVITMSGNAANFAYNPDPASVAASGVLPITVFITDVNGSPMAAETEVKFDASSGTVEPTTVTVPSTGENTFELTYTAPATGGTTETLTVTVTGPVSLSDVIDTFPITVTP